MTGEWYSLEIGDGILSADPAAEIQAEFMKLFTAAGKPSNMAVFSRLESEGRLHCEMVVYFSPQAGELARKFEARLCKKPSRAELGLLAGGDNAWDLFLPE